MGSGVKIGEIGFWYQEYGPVDTGLRAALPWVVSLSLRAVLPGMTAPVGAGLVSAFTQERYTSFTYGPGCVGSYAAMVLAPSICGKLDRRF